MRLLYFPALVHKEVFLHLDLPQLFLLSLCSQKSKTLIRTRRRQKAEIEVSISGYMKSIGAVYSMKSNGMESEVRLDDMLPSEERSNFDGVLVVNGIELRYRTSNDPFVSLGYVTSPPCPIMPILHYLCDLLRVPSDPLFKIYTFLISDIIPPNYIKNSVIPLLSFDKLAVHGFYETQSGQEFSMVKHGFNRFGFQSTDNHPIHHVKNLVVLNIGWEGIRCFLNNFKGENAVFESEHCNERIIREFLKTWMGRETDNLRSIIFNYREIPHFNTENALEGIERVDDGDRPNHFPYESVIQKYHPIPMDFFDCAGGIDIRRPSDGRRATIKITSESFRFFVWQ